MSEHVVAPASRNDPCPCGSGKRYKHCHGVASTASAPAPAVPSAQDLALAGLRAQQADQFEIAESYYRKSLELSPSDPDVLHMLGVTRLQQFDYVEARSLIERAGVLTNWQFPSFRHNRAHLLSAYITGRASPEIAKRMHVLEDTRLSRVAADEKNFAAIIVANPRPEAGKLEATIRSLTRLKVPPMLIVVVSTAALEAPNGIENATFVPSMDRAIDELSKSQPEYVVVAPEGMLFNENFGGTLSDVAASRSEWAILASERSEGDFKGAERKSCISRLRNNTRVGAMLLDDAQVHDLFALTAWKMQFLKRLINTAAPLSALDLAFDALWYDEPMFIASPRATQTTEAKGDWWSLNTGAVDRYVERALTPAEPSNPIAPCVAVDGLTFIKRALRVWIGGHLESTTLDSVGQAIDRRTLWRNLRNDGVEFIGFAKAESGLGESMRLLIRAARSVDLPCAVGDVVLDVGMRQNDRSVEDLISAHPVFKKRVICVNPDALGEAMQLDGVDTVQDVYQIGYWYWELERIPKRWSDSAKLVNEIWVASDFVANAVRSMCDTDVKVVTPPLLTPRLSRPYVKSEFGLADNAFVFLFSFAYGSFATRKNPEAVIRAFRAAFANSIADVRLVIKTSQSELFQTQVDALMAEASDDARIVFLNQYLSRDELTGLQSVCDCYVSLHRSEGLGLGMAEAMSLGKPTIGTGYSGNLVFMNESNSLLVDYTMVPIGPGEYIDAEGQSWADANIEDAAGKMRFVYENQAHALALGQNAKLSLEHAFSLHAVGQRVKRSLLVV
jgi:glycosyltransferase involved in cell wall biosynthesis